MLKLVERIINFIRNKSSYTWKKQAFLVIQIKLIKREIKNESNLWFFKPELFNITMYVSHQTMIEIIDHFKNKF